MSAIQEPGLASEGMGEEEQNKVRAQLSRLLESHLFRNSRRYPVLLRFLVEETLGGRGDLLKERLIGVHVFERPADYDTAADPVVRVTVAEIRKRIAQYYHDEEHDAELRIEMLPGRYAPEFRFRTGHKSQDVVAELEPQMTVVPVEAVPIVPALPVAQEIVVSRRMLGSGWGRITLSVLAVVLMLVAAVQFLLRRSAVDELWQPLLGSSRAMLICVPTGAGRYKGPAPLAPSEEAPEGENGFPTSTFWLHQALGENIVYSDMLASLKVANVLAMRHRDFRVMLNTGTTFDDLRQSPAVLIGGMDNQWSMQTISALRFGFAGSPAGDRYWISDTQHPQSRQWTLDLTQPVDAVKKDYAVIARVHNEQTGQAEFVIAGIGMTGTAAAGEFVSDERCAAELRKQIGPGFRDRDFEAVLSTDVINGVAGSPKIVAVYSW